MTGPPRLCIPVVHTADLAVTRNEHAIAENPSNSPLGIDALAMPARPFAALVTSKRWAPGRLLTITFRGGRQSDRNAVLAATREWSRYANIRFAYTSSNTATIKCQFWDLSRDQTSWSYLGTDALLAGVAQPTINIGWPGDPGRDLHEIGHALGLIHEHQNPLAKIPWDREAVYRYYTGPPNYWTRADVDRQVFNNVTEPLTNGGFDRNSVMLYPIPLGLVTDPKYVVGWNKVLSEGDKRLVRRAYPPMFAGETEQPSMSRNTRVNVESILSAVAAAVSEGDLVDLRKLQEVVIAAYIAGGRSAIWPAMQARIDEFVTDPEFVIDVNAILKAVHDPTIENAIAAALEAANSPRTKAVAAILFRAVRDLVNHPHLD